jgi:hypothetical protein
MWMYIGKTTRVSIRGVSAVMHFPDVLKLPQEKLELFQLGWRASDKDEKNGRPAMSTTQPWQALDWTAVRYGKLYVRIVSARPDARGGKYNDTHHRKKLETEVGQQRSHTSSQATSGAGSGAPSSLRGWETVKPIEEGYYAATTSLSLWLRNLGGWARG